MTSMTNNSTATVRRELAIKDLEGDNHLADVAYHMAWIAEMSQAEFDAYCLLVNG